MKCLNRIFIKFFFIVISLSYSNALLASEIKLAYKLTPQKNEIGANGDIVYMFEPYNEHNIAPYIGVSINSQGATSYAYGGLQYKKDLTEILFFEISLGAAATFNKPLTHTNGKRRALGSRVLFMESVSFGAYIGEKMNIAITADHISNANIIPPNHGLTFIGVCVGYEF